MNNSDMRGLNRGHEIPFRLCARRAFLVWLVLGGWVFTAPASPAAVPERWDTASDTWVATDALGRALPTADQAGPPRANRFVGIFYFLWLGQHGEAGPFDITKILAADPAAMSRPDSPLWGPLYAPHHWGEPIFGYYVSDDESVLARHAQMLADADIDVVIFDVTNQLTYPRSWQALCRVWDRIRKRGGRTPQIAFLCPFGDPKKVVNELFDQLYEPGLYPGLWFRWEGKPLILADPARLEEEITVNRHDIAAELQAGHTLGQAFTATKPFDAVGGCFPTWRSTGAVIRLTLFRGGPNGESVVSREFRNVPDNAWLSLKFPQPQAAGSYYLEMSDPQGRLGWWTSANDRLPGGQAYADGTPVAGARNVRLRFADEQLTRLRSFFTFRKPQPDYFIGPTGPNQWGWLEVFPQHAFTNAAGRVEEVTVGVAQNAVDGRLSVLSNPRAHGRSFHDGKEPGPDGQDFTGRNFAEQWQRAFALDPAFIFVTGWNEWIAGRFDRTAPFYEPGPVSFVDEFDREYSRDCEPMTGGHGDAFYYQLVANIRRFKGVRPLPPVTPRSIQIDGRFNDWTHVAPEFRDDVGDPVQRDHRGWGKGTRYVNQTGRNDIVAAKVSFDAQRVFFYVRTAGQLTPPTNPNWMLLFLNVDGNATNGWLGYDFVVNRSGVTPTHTTIQRHTGQGCQWADPVQIDCRVGEREIELAIPRSVLGLPHLPATIDFKWADNLQQTGEASDFTLNGDAAPNDRFNYRARLEATAEQR